MQLILEPSPIASPLLSWWSEMWEALKEWLAMPPEPVPVPIPVEAPRPRRRR